MPGGGPRPICAGKRGPNSTIRAKADEDHPAPCVVGELELACNPGEAAGLAARTPALLTHPNSSSRRDHQRRRDELCRGIAGRSAAISARC